jgi:hypothetical protein
VGAASGDYAYFNSFGALRGVTVNARAIDFVAGKWT